MWTMLKNGSRPFFFFSSGSASRGASPFFLRQNRPRISITKMRVKVEERRLEDAGETKPEKGRRRSNNTAGEIMAKIRRGRDNAMKQAQERQYR